MTAHGITRRRSAWPLHAGVLAVSAMAAAAYLTAGPHPRVVIFALVTLAPVATFAGALATGRLPDRRPWLTAAVGLVLLSVSMAFWSDWVTAHHLGRAEGRPADLAIASAHLVFLAGTAGVLRKHGANDHAGLLDAALFGVCVAGPIWVWLIAPRLTPAATPLGEMLVLADLAVLAAVLGCLVRIGRRATRARGPIAYLVLTASCTLAAHLTSVATAAHGSTDATTVLLMLAYLTIAAAPLHPAASLVTNPDRPGKEATGEPPLLWMGAALCANPLIAAIQLARGDETANVLLPVGSMLAVPLVLLRLRQMSALRGEAERTLAHHAHHDELTGLHNRRHVVAEIDRALADLERGDLAEVTLLLLDLDGFKPVNDHYGHQAGDVVLREVASRLAAIAGAQDVVGRIGGDEFVVLRRGGGREELAGRVASEVGRPIPVGSATVRVGASAGTATAGRGEAVDRDTLIGRADAAMYAEKATHRRDRARAAA
ncbi:diguanylate cyclase domain-containing protein [Actinoplanes sp. CA-030573]|uniref:diguanylate cyclase domain-containing protein n=1 Tax=Actinoplanes sp. CA-030573 TaxID=3239898 RepID=UPI003D945C80